MTASTLGAFLSMLKNFQTPKSAQNLEKEVIFLIFLRPKYWPVAVESRAIGWEWMAPTLWTMFAGTEYSFFLELEADIPSHLAFTVSLHSQAFDGSHMDGTLNNGLEMTRKRS